MEIDPNQQAFFEWNQIVNGSVLDANAAREIYGINTLATHNDILGALRPTTVKQVQQIIRTANHYKIPLYPISTGHNWGYGGPTPVQNNCMVLDLSLMNKILFFDKKLGIVTLEPGVTQGQLKEFLAEQNANFLVPVTGAGPSCSLVGNALERGYGLNPYVDHFAAVNAIEAVLPNGEIYQTPQSELGCPDIDRAFKWGVGPYIDGLFSQGNFGVVTSITIALAPKPEYELGMLFSVTSDDKLFELTDTIRNILQEVGVTMGSLKLTNQHRLISILELFPEKKGTVDFLTLDENIDKALQNKKIHAWMGSTAIYGSRSVVTAVKHVLKKKLKGKVKDLVFLNPATFTKLTRILPYIPIIKHKINLLTIIKKVENFLYLMSGNPSEIALPIAYAKSGRLPVKPQALNPDRDGCGLIWFSPLIPMHSEQLKLYLITVKSILVEYLFEPVVTFTTLSNQCFDSAVPILFNKNLPEEVKRAENCYRALFAACQKQEFLPYRMPIQFMDLYVKESSPYWQLVKTLKNSIDPENIISPGRYNL